MKNFVFVTIIIFAFALANIAQQTDCGICQYPFSPNPPCGEICKDLIVVPKLINATESEFRYFFALDENTARKLVTLNNSLKDDKKNPSIAVYEKALDEEQLLLFRIKLNSLNENEIKYLQKPESDKEKLETRKNLDKFFSNIDEQKFRLNNDIRKSVVNDSIQNPVVNKSPNN